MTLFKKVDSIHKNVKDIVLVGGYPSQGYLIQIILLLILLIFPVVQSMTEHNSVIFNLTFSFFVIYSLVIAIEFRWFLFITGSASIISMWLVSIKHYHIDHPFLVVESVFLLVFLLGLLFYQARRTLSVSISLHLIFLCLANYLLLCGIFGVSFRLVHLLDHNAFNYSVHDEYNHLYMSLEVFASVGLGDLVPLAPLAKAVVSICGITGQIYLAFFVAFIMGKYLNLKTQE